MQAMEKLMLQDEDISRLIISAKDVACAHPAHSAEHALLVLVKSGYSAIPVVSSEGKVVGAISKTRILDKILGLQRIEIERLSEYLVEDVMNPDVARVTTDEPFMRALQLSIDAPFLCVEDVDGKFVGLLTRRGILAVVHHQMQRSKSQSDE